MPTAWCWIVLLLVVALTWLAWIWRRQHSQGRTAAVITVQRLLKPRTPDACLACRQLVATSTPTISLRPPVTPWREVKSRRGAPKRIDTAGFACPNGACAYYRITDAQVYFLDKRRRQRNHQFLDRSRLGSVFGFGQQPIGIQTRQALFSRLQLRALLVVRAIWMKHCFSAAAPAPGYRSGCCQHRRCQSR